MSLVVGLSIEACSYYGYKKKKKKRKNRQAQITVDEHNQQHSKERVSRIRKERRRGDEKDNEKNIRMRIWPVYCIYGGIGCLR